MHNIGYSIDMAENNLELSQRVAAVEAALREVASKQKDIAATVEDHAKITTQNQIVVTQISADTSELLSYFRAAKTSVKVISYTGKIVRWFTTLLFTLGIAYGAYKFLLTGHYTNPFRDLN